MHAVNMSRSGFSFRPCCCSRQVPSLGGEALGAVVRLLPPLRPALGHDCVVVEPRVRAVVVHLLNKGVQGGGRRVLLWAACRCTAAPAGARRVGRERLLLLVPPGPPPCLDVVQVDRGRHTGRLVEVAHIATQVGHLVAVQRQGRAGGTVWQAASEGGVAFVCKGQGPAATWCIERGCTARRRRMLPCYRTTRGCAHMKFLFVLK